MCFVYPFYIENDSDTNVFFKRLPKYTTTFLLAQLGTDFITYSVLLINQFYII